MNNDDYASIAEAIDTRLMVHQEDDFIYLLFPDLALGSGLLFQSTESAIILWSVDCIGKTKYSVFKTIRDTTDKDLIIPFVETEEELQALTSLGAYQIDYSADDDDNYCKKYGSFVLRKQK